MEDKDTLFGDTPSEDIQLPNVLAADFSVAMEEIQHLQKSRNEAVITERDRLKGKYGNMHPQVQRLDTLLAHQEGMTKHLDQMIVRAGAAAQPNSQDLWRVNGQILQEDFSPQKGVTVYLADQSGNWLKDLPYSATDGRGAFTLLLGAKLLDKYRRQVLFLYVSDQNRRIIGHDPEPLMPERDASSFRQVVISQVSTVSPPDSVCPPAAYIALPKFVVFVGEDRRYYFHLKAKNAEVVLQSKGYERKEEVMLAINLVKENVKKNSFQKHNLKNKQYYFNIVTENKQILATSKTYESVRSRDHAIKLVTMLAPDTPLEVVE